MKELYPLVNQDKDVPQIIKEIVRIRNDDVDAFAYLTQQFVLGRGRFTTRDAPADATDVLASDQEGDYCNDATYEYKLLNIGGTLLWDRRTLDTGW